MEMRVGNFLSARNQHIFKREDRLVFHVAVINLDFGVLASNILLILLKDTVSVSLIFPNHMT